MPRLQQNDEPVVDTASGVPIRQCAATRERYEQHAMIRFARAPSGEVTPDVRGKLPGRGVWITAERKTIDKAAENGVFSRGFKSATRAT